MSQGDNFYPRYPCPHPGAPNQPQYNKQFDPQPCCPCPKPPCPAPEEVVLTTVDVVPLLTQLLSFHLNAMAQKNRQAQNAIGQNLCQICSIPLSRRTVCAEKCCGCSEKKNKCCGCGAKN